MQKLSSLKHSPSQGGLCGYFFKFRIPHKFLGENEKHVIPVLHNSFAALNSSFLFLF
jgi:hypothetical protein